MGGWDCWEARQPHGRPMPSGSDRPGVDDAQPTQIPKERTWSRHWALVRSLLQRHHRPTEHADGHRGRKRQRERRRPCLVPASGPDHLSPAAVPALGSSSPPTDADRSSRRLHPVRLMNVWGVHIDRSASHVDELGACGAGDRNSDWASVLSRIAVPRAAHRLQLSCLIFSSAVS